MDREPEYPVLNTHILGAGRRIAGVGGVTGIGRERW